MKIITNNKIYIQKKLELIFKTVNTEEIPNIIINKYNENIEIQDLDFIDFEKNVLDFLNTFWFIIDYKDYIDLTWLESADFYIGDLDKLRVMRMEYDKHKFLDEKKEYKDMLEKFFHDIDYIYLKKTK